MSRSDCLFEWVSHIGLGIALLFIVLGLSLIGVTALPVLGIFVAAAVFFLSAFFFLAPRSQECTIA